jgi:hypothetical protein
MRFFPRQPRALVWLFCLCAVWGTVCWGQGSPHERAFPQSKAVVEKAVRSMASSSSGRLPVLDGFAESGAHPLDHYQKGYYQCSVQVAQSAAGGSLVKVTAKITAWYADAAQPGYQVLSSNGRLEADFLDRLQEVLNSVGAGTALDGKTPRNSEGNPSVPGKPRASTSLDEAESLSAPAPGGSTLADAIAASRTPLKSPEGISKAPDSGATAALDHHNAELEKEAQGLEEILRNQAHPSNLAAVKKSGTPVMTNPNEGAKVLFLAEAEDEFEILDSNASWVHIRISGLSRGWILRSSVELAEDFETPAPVTEASAKAESKAPVPASTTPFQVENEQIASFPGEWEPLRGKTVKIISVQKTAPSGSDGQAKLDFAKSLFNKEYDALSQSSSTAAGIVVIFDSEDGGMMGTTVQVLRLWKNGSLSDDAMWRRCYFDPPDAFAPTGRP